MSLVYHVGQRISYDRAICTVRYIGQVEGTSGQWLGVEWDDSSRGKHDGSHKGTRYFTCISRASACASFVRPSRPAGTAQSFLPALKGKYSPDENEGEARSRIYFSGKVAQEMGFDKIRRQQGDLKEMKVAIADGLAIDRAFGQGEETKSIAETVPKIQTLDLSRNLFASLRPVVDICGELPDLQHLLLNGNRFSEVRDVLGVEEAFQSIRELSLEDNLLSWEDLCSVARQCRALSTLNVGSNQLLTLPSVAYADLTSTLTTINLEFNDFRWLSELSSLTCLTSLRNLHLKGNNIVNSSPPDTEPVIFPLSLQYLDVSYNNIKDWSFIDSLVSKMPGLTALRIAHNPIFDQADAADQKTSASEEAQMFTIARLANLKALNFSAITKSDRSNAEMFYLSRIGKQLATVPEAAEASVLEMHPRYAGLCEIYGAPDVIRRDEINPSFLEARLITVRLQYGEVSKNIRLPRSFDVYAVKGFVGGVFHVSPMKVKLVWETGEWDPVGGFDDGEEDSGDEDSGHVEDAENEASGEHDVAEQQDKAGRWVKREVELKDGPRQLGYCVDGMDVTIRVEVGSSF